MYTSRRPANEVRPWPRHGAAGKPAPKAQQETEVIDFKPKTPGNGQQAKAEAMTGSRNQRGYSS
ncbi:hypothetical protein CEY11_23405 [Candidimonas nitroreducens]|uniref:Uncharacterized protein n=1 Tax=Candidimonas nitroreducens TaxID=683354 RepID=A0A225M154_9BURK|nr:hypothetical protein CEY11_23405 [Candidimonas nitroreducens]